MSANENDFNILIEFPERRGLRSPSTSSLSREELAERSGQALDTAVQLITAVAEHVSSLRSTLPEDVAGAEIEFGVKLDVDLGAVLSGNQGDGSLRIKLTWQRPERLVAALPQAPATPEKRPSPAPDPLPNPTIAEA